MCTARHIYVIISINFVWMRYMTTTGQCYGSVGKLLKIIPITPFIPATLPIWNSILLELHRRLNTPLYGNSLQWWNCHLSEGQCSLSHCTSCIKMFLEHDITALPWPPDSPEHLWGVLNWQVQSAKHLPRNLQKLNRKPYSKISWHKIPKRIWRSCRNHVCLANSCFASK